MWSFWSIFAAIIVYVFSQYLSKYVLDPIKDFHGAAADISFTTLRFQSAITNPQSNDSAEIRGELWELAADMISKAGQIPAYELLSRTYVFRLPPIRSVLKAAQELNGIAYSFGAKGEFGAGAFENVQSLKEIAAGLKIRTSYED